MLTQLNIPKLIEPAYSLDNNNLSFVFDSDLSNTYSFRYIYQLYINGTYIATLRNAPNIEQSIGTGVMIPARMIEDFLSYDLIRDYGITNAPNSMLKYEMSIGEESDLTIGGTGQMGATYSVGYTGYAWNGTLQYAEESDYTQFLIGPTSNARFLTNAPNEQDIDINESSFLYWLNGITGPTGASASTYPLAVKITVGTASYYTFPQELITPYTMSGIAIGPADINALAANNMLFNAFGATAAGPVITCDSTYTVQITDFVPAG